VNRSTRPLLSCGESVELAAEEVDPQIPVRRDSQESLADETKEAAYEMAMWAKLWSSTL
jgi:hypothetical protein